MRAVGTAGRPRRVSSRPIFGAARSGSWGTFAQVTTDAAQNARPATEVDRIAEDYLEAFVDLSPITATYLGIAGDEDLDDFSPAGRGARRAARRHPRRPRPRDTGGRHRPRHHRRHAGGLGLAEETHRAGLDEMALNVIASPLQEVRGTFDLMPTATSEDWGVIARRMAKVPAAIDSWMKSLHSAADKGNVAPRRRSRPA